MARPEPIWCATCGGLLADRAPANDYTCVCKRPLFIPLKGEFYDAFADGSKTTEYRRYGPRWNERTCVIGRPVVLSRGYGKAHRTRGRIVGFYRSALPTRTDAWRACYGDTGDERAACISIAVQP